MRDVGREAVRPCFLTCDTVNWPFMYGQDAATGQKCRKMIMELLRWSMQTLCDMATARSTNHLGGYLIFKKHPYLCFLIPNMF